MTLMEMCYHFEAQEMAQFLEGGAFGYCNTDLWTIFTIL